MSVNYNNKQKQMLHQMLTTVFSNADLVAFSAAYFPDVFDPFTDTMEYEEKVQLLIESCAERQSLGRLVALVQKEKPEQYHAFVQGVKNNSDTSAADETNTANESAPADLASTRSRDRAGQIISNPAILLQKSLAGRYHIEELLDENGLAAVFKARDTKLDMTVAIKVIDMTKVTYHSLRERVRQEVRLAMSLDHPNIVKFYDLGQNESLVYIIMEYLPGRNLRQAREYFETLERKVAIPQIVGLFKELCDTVDYLHQRRILHPGTKPENIMIKSNGGLQPVLINLGLLRPNREVLMSGDVSSRRLTYSVSPELLLGHNTDLRSDIYGLGVLLYEMMTGQPPFEPTTLAEACTTHIETPPRRPGNLRPDIPQEIETIILKALAKDPADRYLSAKGMAQDLAAFLDGTRLPQPADSSDRQPQQLAGGLDLETSLDLQTLTLQPGQSSKKTLLLINNSAQEDRRKIDLDGLPAEWVTITPAVTTLSPGEKEEVTLKFKPPQTIDSQANQYAVTVRVVNQTDPEQYEALQFNLTVASFTRLTCSMLPKQIDLGQTVNVTVENQGNSTQPITIKAKPDTRVRIEPAEMSPSLEAGQSGTYSFTVKSHRRYWLGNAITQTFSLQISAPDASAQTLTGEVTMKGIFSPRMVLGVLLTLLLFACGLLTVYFSFNLPFSDVQATAQAATVTSQAIVNIQAAATSQATLDTDGDGLINQQEEAYSTDPNNADSDGDGLSDGKEVMEFGTDPRDPDTDSDGLPDGEEVQLGLDPTNRDSNNNNLPDRFEPTPGAPTPLPTPIVVVTATPRPTSNIIVFVGFRDPGYSYDGFLPFSRPTPTFNARPEFFVQEDARTARVPVILSQPANQPVTVAFQTSDNSALANEDYAPVSGVLTFPPGDTLEEITVIIYLNGFQTSNRTLDIFLSNPTNARLGIDHARLTIMDVD